MAREFVNQGNYKAAQDFLNTICMGTPAEMGKLPCNSFSNHFFLKRLT
jgi:hypothetical protein